MGLATWRRRPQQKDPTDADDRLRPVEDLVELARLDWGHADLHLRAAQEMLRPLLSADEHRARLRVRENLQQLAASAGRAVRRGDWREAERLAESGVALEARLKGEARLLAVGEAVYGRWLLSPDATALALTGAVAHPAGTLRARIRVAAGKLRSLAAASAGPSDFFERRARHFELLDLQAEEVPAVAVDPSELRDAAVEAADSADFAAILRVARGAVEARQDAFGRVRGRPPARGSVEHLSDPFPATAIERAAGLGLERICVAARSDLNAYLSCACADRPSLPEEPLSEVMRTPEGCTCGHACPPGVSPTLKSSLDALMVHVALTSGGTRYLPWFGAEELLVETFAEDGVDAGNGLLEALSLPRRRGLPRAALEDALLRNGPRLCEELGLEPETYRIVCVPFDVYLRVGPERGWGRREMWTHFDGYQMTRALELQALVGGDVRFGGVDDLCGVNREYDSDRIAVRFAVVRRERFLAREPSAGAT